MFITVKEYCKFSIKCCKAYSNVILSVMLIREWRIIEFEYFMKIKGWTWNSGRVS